MSSFDEKLEIAKINVLPASFEYLSPDFFSFSKGTSLLFYNSDAGRSVTARIRFPTI
ncbi:Uncharacterised protein [uncultured Clostridium sp.]|nr:Uncharacterised protein [uncultured Clostridium sp.]